MPKRKRGVCERGNCAHRDVVERFGPIGIAMAVLVEGERLVLMIRRVTVFGIPLPSWLRPGGVAYEHTADGRFNFFVEIRAPLAGLIVGYRGWLVESSGA